MHSNQSEQTYLFNQSGEDQNQSWLGLRAFFPRLAPAAYFPEVSTSYLASLARDHLHVLPRLAPNCIVFPRFAPVAWFPALNIGCIFISFLLDDCVVCVCFDWSQTNSIDYDSCYKIRIVGRVVMINIKIHLTISAFCLPDRF